MTVNCGGKPRGGGEKELTVSLKSTPLRRRYQKQRQTYRLSYRERHRRKDGGWEGLPRDFPLLSSLSASHVPAPFTNDHPMLAYSSKLDPLPTSPYYQLLTLPLSSPQVASTLIYNSILSSTHWVQDKYAKLQTLGDEEGIDGTVNGAHRVIEEAYGRSVPINYLIDASSTETLTQPRMQYWLCQRDGLGARWGREIGDCRRRYKVSSPFDEIEIPPDCSLTIRLYRPGFVYGNPDTRLRPDLENASNPIPLSQVTVSRKRSIQDTEQTSSPSNGLLNLQTFFSPLQETVQLEYTTYPFRQTLPSLQQLSTRLLPPFEEDSPGPTIPLPRLVLR